MQRLAALCVDIVDWDYEWMVEEMFIGRMLSLVQYQQPVLTYMSMLQYLHVSYLTSCPIYTSTDKNSI